MIIDNGKTIRYRREYNVGVEKLFSAWTQPATFAAWWKGLVVKEMDARPGGKYILGWSQATDAVTKGEFREFVPNQRIVMTWNNNGKCSGAQGTPVVDSVVTLSFKSIGPNKSTLELIHENLPPESVDGHASGWAYCLLDLDQFFNEETRKIDPSLQVRVTRTLPHPVSQVFAAWTQPALMNQWFNSTGNTAGKATIDLKQEGSFSMDYQMPKTGEIFRIYGDFKEVIPNQKLVFTWIEDNPNAEPQIDRQFASQVAVSFKDLGAKTEVEILHTKISIESMMKNFQSGWAGCMDSMERVLRQTH